jgi:hypothetical protein
MPPRMAWAAAHCGRLLLVGGIAANLLILQVDPSRPVLPG